MQMVFSKTFKAVFCSPHLGPLAGFLFSVNEELQTFRVLLFLLNITFFC